MCSVRFVIYDCGFPRMKFSHFFSNFYVMLSPLPEKIKKERVISFLWSENVISVLLGVISFCVYLTTMCRSVGFTDSGELATVICTLGIAHPTGYPLFTLLGKCWMMIPAPLEEIFQLNIFAALLTAIAVGVFFKATLILRRSELVFQVRNRKRKEPNDRRFILASTIASLVLGFSTTFWSQSTAIEVYPLHLVLIILSTLLFVGGLEEQLNQSQVLSRKLILFAFVLGLSFSNHMTTILLAPGFLWLYFRLFGFGKESFRRILNIAPFFLFGLSIYLYMPIRSSGNPLLDWGHPATLERFFWHVSGKQFRVWMFSGWSVVQKQLSYFVDNFTSEFHLAVIACIVIGMFELFRRSRRMFIFLAFLFLTTIVYAVNYDIFDIGSYFLLSYIVIGWIAAYGIDFLFDWISDKQSWMKAMAVVILTVLPIVQIMNNWNGVDETKNVLPQQFVWNAFSHFETNAVVVASQWDYFLSPSLYYQFIRNERHDITIIDKSLLQNRSWYFIQLQRQSPKLMERIKPSANLFLEELDKFEHDIPFNFNIIQSCWQNLLNEIVEKSIPDRPVYIDARIDREFSSGYYRTPAGLFLRLTKKEDTTCYKTALTPFGIWDKKRPVTKDFEQYYIAMLIREADWLLNKGRADEAKTVLAEVLHIEPGNFSASWLMKKRVK
jgi:hypothetical protein